MTSSTPRRRAVVAVVLVWLALTALPSSSALKKPPPLPSRPDLVRRALENDRPLYYFGLGSNMSRKKLENRGINGTKIEALSFEPAVVPGHRLAFNLRGFPPIEPGMGSLEPCDSGARALLRYREEECHGALAKLTAENYRKVMASEGITDENPNPGYEEVVVDAFPYGRSFRPVKAVALRARPHVRLDFDPPPSARYMGILREGARELGLKPCYQEFLEEHPVQETARWQRRCMVYNFAFNRLLGRKLLGLQSKLMWLVYAAPTAPLLARMGSGAATALIILPGFLAGYLFCVAAGLLGKTPPFVATMMKMLDVADS